MWQKGERSLNNKFVFPFNSAILLMCMGTCNTVEYTISSKEGLKSLKFCTLVHLNGFYCSSKLIFNQQFKLNKHF